MLNELALFSTPVLVAVTAYYAITTHRMQRTNTEMLKAMRDQNTALNRPYISATVMEYPGRPIFVLRIANTGRSGAHDLRLAVDRDYFRFGTKNPESNLRSFPAFQNVIPMFASGARVEFDLIEGFKEFKVDDPLSPALFSITAKYFFEGREYSETSYIDLRPFAQSRYSYDPIQHELKEIREILKKIVK